MINSYMKDVYRCYCGEDLDTFSVTELLRHIRRCEKYKSQSELHQILKKQIYPNNNGMPPRSNLRVLLATAQHLCEEVEDVINSYDILLEERKKQPVIEMVKCSVCQTSFNPYDKTIKLVYLNSCMHPYCEPCLNKIIAENLPKTGAFHCYACLGDVPLWELKVFYNSKDFF